MKNKHVIFYLVCSFLLVASVPLFAQETSFDEALLFDEDEMFSDVSEVEVEITETNSESAVTSFLKTETAKVGGSFSASISPFWTWNNPWENFEINNFDSYGMKPQLSALLFVDSRPSETNRIYGSVKTSWPFTKSKTIENTNIQIPDISVFELFTDFSWNDSLYFRFGKQTINWGVGYFYSPANFMNLETIDVFNPEEQLEGPVALRVHFPIPQSQHNLWAYAVFNTEDMLPEETAIAAKAEFVLGSWELGSGVYYLYDNPFKAMLTASGSIGKIGIFGEASVSFGTKRSLVTKISDPLENIIPNHNFITYSGDRDDVFFEGTLGFQYMNTDYDFSIIGQYYYDGTSYAKTDREARIFEARENEDNIKSLITNDVYNGILKALIASSGQHYAALNFSKTEIFCDKFSFNCLVLANMSDFSFYLYPSFSYSFFDELSVSLGTVFILGNGDTEYVVLNDGNAFSLKLGVNLGINSF